jgi:hypothetical protein
MRDQKLSSVIFMTALRMNGAAKTTTGSIMSHDISQDEIRSGSICLNSRLAFLKWFSA